MSVSTQFGSCNDRAAITSTEWVGERETECGPITGSLRQNLGRLMAEQRMTQASLARTMQVSRVAVHAWIWGTCFPETSRLIKLAQTLSVTVGDLIEGDSAATSLQSDTSNEEALLLNAFRKLPNTARLSLLADAYELSAQVSRSGVKRPSGYAERTLRNT